MDFDHNENQSEILNGLDSVISAFSTEPPHEGALNVWAGDLDQELATAGYLDLVASGLDLLDGALVVERLARLPVAVEAATSILLAPALGLELPRPYALTRGSPLNPARFLPQAKTLLVDQGETFLAIEVDPSKVESVDTLLAYPYGRLTSIEGLNVTVLNNAAELRRRWRIGLATEAAGQMAAAIDLVLDHVKTRRAFGKPLGVLQAIQHRLVMATEMAEATRWLALRAAWSDSELDAATAAAFAQDSIARIVTDLHQFTGAMGLTLEYPLHYWTYRLRALVGELGGSSQQAQAVAKAAWG